MGICCCKCHGDSPPYPAHPIVLPPNLPPLYPAHPIVIPPGSWLPQPPEGAHPEHPIYWPPHIWGGGNEPFPTPPIWLPPNPDLPPVDPGQPPEGISGPVTEGYVPPSNDGSNYFVAKPGTVLPTGPIGYLILPIYPQVNPLPK